MKIYLSGRYQRRAEIEAHAADLRALGHDVVSTWHKEDLTALNILAHAGDQSAVDRTTLLALQDLTEVEEARLFIAHTELPGQQLNTGGRHVEYGYALACMMACHPEDEYNFLIVGPRENVFYLTPAYRQFDIWPDALRHIGAAPAVARR